jgi:hypothetical protein
MPEPIKVDFRKKRRPAPKVAKTSARPAHRATGSGEKAVNWRALPKFALFVLAMALLFAGLNWGMKAIGLGG